MELIDIELLALILLNHLEGVFHADLAGQFLKLFGELIG